MQLPSTSNLHRYVQVFLIIGFVIISSLGSRMASANSDGSDSPYFVEGYDLVSYFSKGGPVPGNTEIKTEYDGRVLLFSSEENMAQFLADPATFMPAYNGYCAFGMAYGMKSKIDPMQYNIVDGRLYLQLDSGTKRRWSRKIGRYIKRSDRAWSKLLTRNEVE